MTLKWLLWSKIDFFGQNWPNDTFLDYFELVIPGFNSNWMFQTESNGIKLTQMTHLERHVTNHVINNLKFESSYLVNQIKWIIQSATSLKTDNLSNRSLPSHEHVRTRTSWTDTDERADTNKSQKVREIQGRQTGSIEKVFYVWHFRPSRNHQFFEKKNRTIIFVLFRSIIMW